MSSLLGLLFRFFGPTGIVVIAMLGGGIVAGGVGWAWNTLIDNPAVARAAEQRAADACAIRVTDAANRAEAAERARQQQISADALAAYRHAVDEQSRLRSAAEDKLDQEIADHEEEMRAAGRSCLVTDDDFDWLRHNQPAAPGGGR